MQSQNVGLHAVAATEIDEGRTKAGEKQDEAVIGQGEVQQGLGRNKVQEGRGKVGRMPCHQQPASHQPTSARRQLVGRHCCSGGAKAAPRPFGSQPALASRSVR